MTTTHDGYYGVFDLIRRQYRAERFDQRADAVAWAKAQGLAAMITVVGDGRLYGTWVATVQAS